MLRKFRPTATKIRSGGYEFFCPKAKVQRNGFLLPVIRRFAPCEAGLESLRSGILILVKLKSNEDFSTPHVFLMKKRIFFSSPNHFFPYFCHHNKQNHIIM